jgi:hypothetical protein
VKPLDLSNDVNELNQRLLHANERLTALYESAQTITSMFELNQVLERLAQSTARVMVPRYGGQISVQSQVSAGTTFTVAFPVIQ